MPHPPGTSASPPPTARVRLVLAAGLAFLVATVCTGPYRWGLTLAHLAPLIYIPNGLLLVAIAWQMVFDWRRSASPMLLLGVVIPLGACVIGLQFQSPAQVAMGVYSLLPFWYALACGVVLLEHRATINRIVPTLWIVAVAGVLINAAITYPWEGFGYSVGDLDIEGSREWTAYGGAKRLAGISRSSFDAAVQIQLLGILFALTTRHRWFAAIISVVTAVAVYLTTTKGVLLVFVVVTPLILMRGLLPESLLRGLPLLFGFIGLALPMSSLMFEFRQDGSDAAMADLAFSFYDRLNSMWPDAWRLLHDHGHWLLGRGFGGIGTAQTYFEPEFFDAGDNLFMYWFVIFGWLGLPAFLMLLLRTLTLRPNRDANQFLIYCLLLATVVYGLTTNIVENATFAMACGIVVRWLCGSASLPDPTEFLEIPCHA